MRNFLFLLIAFGLCIQLIAQEGTGLITENFREKPLLKVIRILEKDYKIKLAFDNDLVRGVLVTVDIIGLGIWSAMEKILAGTDLDFALIDNTVVLKPRSRVTPAGTLAVATNITVTGVIRDGHSTEVLPYATIAVKQTGFGSVTNTDGHFTLLNVPADTSTISVNYLGYYSKDIKLNPEMLSVPLKVDMKSAAEILDQVIVNDLPERTVEVANNISQIAFDPRELSSLPNLGERDVFRTLQLLPGISATNETSSGLVVRGSSPDKNLILYDGFSLYHVDHFYGVFSAFNSDAIKDIRIFKGAFAAKYGGRTSSVIDITGKMGNQNEVSGNVGINLIGLNGILEVPIGKKVSFLLAARRSHTDFIESELYKDIFDNILSNSLVNSTDRRFEEITQAFNFSDFNSKVSYRPSNKDIIALSLYVSNDHLTINGSTTVDDPSLNRVIRFFSDEQTDWGNKGFSLRWGRQLTPKFYSNLNLGSSEYFSDILFDVGANLRVRANGDSETRSQMGMQNNSVKDITLRQDNELKIDEKTRVEFGILLTKNDISLVTQFRGDTLQNLVQEGGQASLYGQLEFEPISNLILTAGLRSIYFDLFDTVYFEPRLSAQLEVNKDLILKAGYGHHRQFVNRVIRQEIFSNNPDFWILPDPDGIPISLSKHYILGAKFERASWLFDVEGYIKNTGDVTEYIPRVANVEGGSGNENFYAIGEESVKGIDFLVQKKTGRHTGWLAYSLSSAQNKFPGINDSNFFPSQYDQRHEINLVNMYSTDRWNFSVTWIFGSGKPYTAPEGEYTVTLLDSSQISYIAVGDINSRRLPNYHRLDLAANYNFHIGKKVKAQMGLSIYNVYARKNIKYKKFDRIGFDTSGQLFSGTSFAVTDVELLGFTPNIFLNIEF